jgi:hypothetical protein
MSDVSPGKLGVSMNFEGNKRPLKGNFHRNAVGCRQDFGIDGSIFSAQA